VQGFAGGLIYGTAPALTTLGAPAAVRGRRLGFLGAAMGLGLLGSLPAGALVESFGWRAVYHVRVPLALAVLVWAALTRAEPVERERKPVALGDLTRGSVLRAGALSFVARGAIFAIWLLAPFYLVETRGLGAFVGGFFFMLTPLGTTVAAPLAGPIAWGRRRRRSPGSRSRPSVSPRSASSVVAHRSRWSPSRSSSRASAWASSKSRT